MAEFRHVLVRSLVMHYLDHFGYRGPRVRIFTTSSRIRRHRVVVEKDELGSCTTSEHGQTWVYVKAEEIGRASCRERV